EDGIRDLIVTGVQTCALPIFTHLALLELANGTRHPLPADPARADGHPAFSPDGELLFFDAVADGEAAVYALDLQRAGVLRVTVRSEERRVGKEWDCRRAR